MKLFVYCVHYLYIYPHNYKKMTQTKYMVLYRKGSDLILFDFTCDDDCEDIIELINFHFTDRHDLDRMIENTAKSIFKDFYENANNDEFEFIDFEEINHD